MQLFLVVALIAALTTSCTTQKLWKATDPNARMTISAANVSETELRDRGVRYLKDDFGNFHVEKTMSQRFGDHALRFALTPAAMCLDVAPYAALIAACAYLHCDSSDFGTLTSPSPTQSPWISDHR